MILDEYAKFLDGIFSQLEALKIDVSGLTIDHIAYQAESSEEYEDLLPKFKELGKTLSEEIVGGRRVGIFKMDKKLSYNGQEFYIVELVEPKVDQVVNSGWEHVEMLVNENLENLMQKYPNLDWKTDALDRDVFPMLILKLSEGLSVKFPRRSAEVEVGRIKKLN